ncbi:MAG: type II toxin-antitoxin system VapC family toxin [Chloroflexota bacterium]|nr:type II toxin-antitoxin system VapC family toxin [Chloroflexota bacterium]MDE2960049.1 type II toxin-antitoxin system VapC family toxin [Chloroflexota bacterium]
MITANPEDPPQPELTASETYILDASAAVEYLLARPAGARVAAVIAGAHLIAPDTLDSEVMSALRGRVLQGLIDEARALTALADLDAMPVERISSRTLISLAWGYYHNITAYDALYVAAAKAHRATVLTCDGHLTRAPASVLDVPVRNIPIV